jgi:hypothetical protein
MRRAGDEPLPGQSLMTLAVWPRSVFVVPMYYTTWMSTTPKTKIFLLRSYAATQLRLVHSSAAPPLPHPAPGATPPRVHVWGGRSRVAGEWASGRRNRSSRRPAALAPSRAGGSTRGCGRARVPSCERGCARACNRPPGRDLGACSLGRALAGAFVCTNPLQRVERNTHRLSGRNARLGAQPGLWPCFPIMKQGLESGY